ncbi:MAG: peptide ABC transporter permease [Alphaproteobacteria bacterium]|nr:peptide ABC transporter permease [Alphaproteobacteria bacterium]
MSNKALLNNVDHANLKVRSGYSAEFGDNVNQALIFPTEFAEIQREYPIFFRKDANGAFQSVALLGLDKDENLFLEGDAWQARYVPAERARGPFSIALQRSGRPDAAPEPMIHIDLDHPRVSEREGEALFLPHGGNSPYLERSARVLGLIHQGIAQADAMFAAFESAGLIKPVSVEIKLSETEQYNVVDYFSIDREKLVALDGPNLESLNRAGFLQAAFLVLSSLNNVNRLIEMKNRKREGAWKARANGRGGEA